MTKTCDEDDDDDEFVSITLLTKFEKATQIFLQMVIINVYYYQFYLKGKLMQIWKSVE